MSEAKTQLACKHIAEAEGCLWLRLRPPPQGVPDVLIVGPWGAHVWIEFKAASKSRVRPGQYEFLRGLEKRKAMFWIVHSVEDFVLKLRTVI